MIKKEQSADAKKMLISSLSLKIDANNTSSINECIEHFTNLITQFSGYITAMSPSRVNAIFGAPIAYLDHTLCACLAAYRIQQIVQTTHLECKIHIGIDTFEVMVTGKEDILAYEPIQDTIDLSEKLADVAEENQIRYTASSKTFIHEYVIMTVVENTILSNIETPLPSYVLTGLQLDKVQEKLNRQYYADSYFVGREKEMEQFDHLWQQTKQGGSEVLAVRAKAGIGKTRLFHECAWHAQDDGGKVYSVAALSQEKGIPFSVLRRLVSLLCKLSGTIITEEELKRSLGELSMDNFSELLAMESIYSLFDCIVEKSEWNGLAPILQKKILFNTINDFIALMSKRRAVLLIIEDLQWCDVESLEYVQDFLKSQQEFTCLLLNYREKFHVTKEFHERVSEIELHPLSDNNATKLISHLLPETYEFSHVHKKIMALSGGNPLFIEVYIKVFNEIHRSASTEHRDIDSISNTIEETILLHVSQLNSVDKLVLQQASILGQSFSITLLHYINELAANTLTTSVMRLMEEKMFKRISLYPEPEYSFNHAYIQETLYESISRQTRDTYHQRLVMMLERNYKSKDIRMSLLMAEHAYLGHLWDKALQYYNRLMPSVMGMDFPIERYLKMGEHVQKCFDKMSFTLQKNCFPEYGRATAIYIHTLFISGNGPEAMNHIDKLLFLSRKAHQIVFEVLALGYKVILLFYMNHSTQAHALEDEIQEKLPQALHDFPELMRHSFEGMVYMMLAHPDNALGHYEAFDRKIELGLAAVKDYPYTHAPEYLGAALIPVLYLHMSYSHSVRARWDRLESVLPMLEDLEKILPIAEPLVITSIVLMTYFYSRGELKKSKLYASHSLKNASLLKLHFFYLQAEAYLAAIAYYQKDYDLLFPA